MRAARELLMTKTTRTLGQNADILIRELLVIGPQFRGLLYLFTFGRELCMCVCSVLCPYFPIIFRQHSKSTERTWFEEYNLLHIVRSCCSWMDLSTPQRYQLMLKRPAPHRRRRHFLFIYSKPTKIEVESWGSPKFNYNYLHARVDRSPFLYLRGLYFMSNCVMRYGFTTLSSNYARIFGKKLPNVSNPWGVRPLSKMFKTHRTEVQVPGSTDIFDVLIM